MVYALRLMKPSDAIKFDRPLREHQKEVLDRFYNKECAALFWEMGCISGDAIITVNRGGCARKYTLESFYRKFNRLNNTRKMNPNIPAYIRGLNGSKIGLNKVLAVQCSGIKETLKLRIGTRTLILTPDHKVFTQKGWKCAKNLTARDYVAVDTLTRHKKKKVRKKVKKPRYNLWQVGPYYPYGYLAKNRQGKYNRKEAVHRVIYQAHINKITPEEFISATHHKNLASKLILLDPVKFHVHHKNHDPKDNRLKNLVALSPEEHLRAHGNYDHFGHGNIAWEKVRSIQKYKAVMTYDICCESPNNSFVANGIVVHNSGKTSAAIALLRAKYNMARDVLPTLIISPVATLWNWENEFKINAPKKVQDAVAICYGKGAERQKILSDESKSIFITNPETLSMPQVVQTLNKKRFDLLVVDEADTFKNFKGKRFKALLPISDNASFRLLLTGTPILNSYLDLWSLFRIMDKGATFYDNYFLFREKYFRDENAGWKGKPNYFPKYVPRHGVEQELSDLIGRKASRKKKFECLDLPPLVKMIEHIPMSDEQARAYAEMEAELITEVKAGTCVATNALTKVLRLLQILSGHVETETETYEIQSNPRLDRLRDLLAEITPEHKVIVWAVYKKSYESIRKIFKELKVDYAELTGDTKDRQGEIDRFNNDSACRVMLANPQAGGVGVNLVAASYSIYYSRTYSLRDRLQSEARNHRGGSEIHQKITQIDLVSPDTLDEVLLASLEGKENFAELVLEKIRLRKASK